MKKIKDFIMRRPWLRLIALGVRSLMRDGLAMTWKKVTRTVKIMKSNVRKYTEAELNKQRTVEFPRQVRFSILVPLYNTPEVFLREMIRSVQEQTYANWELCLADGSGPEYAYVEAICREFAKEDSRILYRRLEKNLGISGNTNACIDMASGDYLALFDHDDLLHPAALYEIMKVICEKDADFIYTDEVTFRKSTKDTFNPHFKPDYAPDTLRANNYICHFSVFKRELLEAAGNFRSEYDGSQDYDIILRLTEKAKTIVHIPIILYYWRSHPGSVADNIGAKPYAIDAAMRAISAHLQRVNLKGEVLIAHEAGVYRLKYELEGTPLVSIIIPNFEHKDDLQKCLESIYAKTSYPNFEIIVVENNSKTEEIFDYYKQIQKQWQNLKVVCWDGKFNYSAINNFGAGFASGEHLLLLNNDTEIITPEWIEEMLMYSQRQDVGAVGAKLYYPDDTIQHAGVGIGILGVAGHYFRGVSRKDVGYMCRLLYAQNMSAVTGACMMIRRSVWNEIGGLDESFEVAFNDVDVCMRIRKAGYLVVWTPHAQLYHYESKSRGHDYSDEKRERFIGEGKRFRERWGAELETGDPYYNPNFSLLREDFYVR